METGRAVAPRRQILSATGGVGYDWSSPAQTSLRVYNSSVAKVQVICWATRSNRLIEAVGIDSQFGDPFAQGIAIDPQYVRRAQMIPARLRQRMLEPRLLQRRKRVTVERRTEDRPVRKECGSTYRFRR